MFDRTSYYYRMVLFVLIYITGGDDDGADVGDNGHDGKDDGDVCGDGNGDDGDGDDDVGSGDGDD